MQSIQSIQVLSSIQPSDVCGVCMDEVNRDFLFKTCCTMLLCRKCFNQLEVEAFPDASKCPGCRKNFTKVTFSIESVQDKIQPRAYCGEFVSMETQDQHVNQCIQCLKKVIKGNMWFEMQLSDKFKTLKRKMSVFEDEIFIRNTRIRELNHENRKLSKELLVRNNHILMLQQLRARPSQRPTPQRPTPQPASQRPTPQLAEEKTEPLSLDDVLSSETDLVSSDEDSSSDEHHDASVLFTPVQQQVVPVSSEPPVNDNEEELLPMTPSEHRTPAESGRSLTTPPPAPRAQRVLAPLRRSNRLLFLATQIEEGVRATEL